MSIKAAVFSEIERIRGRAISSAPPLSDELVLLESGLDSLGIAILVTRLEDKLGIDPFSGREIASPPVTLGELVKLYENAESPL